MGHQPQLFISTCIKSLKFECSELLIMNLRVTSLFSQKFSNTKDNLNANRRSSWMSKTPNLYFVTQLFKANSESKTTQKSTLFFSSSSCNSLLLSFKAVSMSSFSILTIESVFLNSYNKKRQKTKRFHLSVSCFF